MYPIGITFVKRLDVPEPAEAMAPAGRWEKCWPREGQVFEVSANGSDFPKPGGSCQWAWPRFNKMKMSFGPSRVVFSPIASIPAMHSCATQTGSNRSYFS